MPKGVEEAHRELCTCPFSGRMDQAFEFIYMTKLVFIRHLSSVKPLMMGIGCRAHCFARAHLVLCDAIRTVLCCSQGV